MFELDLQSTWTKSTKLPRCPKSDSEEEWPLVGQDELMHRLVGFADDAVNRKGLAALMCGTGGMGKPDASKSL